MNILITRLHSLEHWITLQTNGMLLYIFYSLFNRRFNSSMIEYNTNIQCIKVVI